MIEITTKNFEEEIKNFDGTIILEFYGTYCMPCKNLENELKKIDLEDIKLCKINIDNEFELAIRYEILSVPTMVFIDNKKILEKVYGYLSKDEILNKLNFLIKKDRGTNL